MENYYRYEINWKDLVNEKKRTNNSSSYSHKINSSRYDNFKDRTNFNNTITSSDSYKSLDYNKSRNSYSKKISTIDKKNRFSKFIYLFFFVSIIISLFFLSINVGFASPLKENFKEVSIFSDENSTLLLNEYVFNENNGIKEEDTPKELNFKTIEYNKYRIKGKDTIDSVSSKFGLNKDTLILCNDLKKSSDFKNGKILIIPNQNGRIITIESNDSLFKIAGRYGVSWKKIVDVNSIKSEYLSFGSRIFVPESKMTKYENEQFYQTSKFLWPITGRITSFFGTRKDPFNKVYSYHSGIDIKGEFGTLVKPAKDGTVSFTGNDDIYGNNIIIKHSDGYSTRYGHLQEILVKKGNYVTRGTNIGKVGSTGRSTGSHLHFEIRKNGKLSDPLKFLND